MILTLFNNELSEKLIKRVLEEAKETASSEIYYKIASEDYDSASSSVRFDIHREVNNILSDLFAINIDEEDFFEPSDNNEDINDLFVNMFASFSKTKSADLLDIDYTKAVTIFAPDLHGTIAVLTYRKEVDRCTLENNVSTILL